MAVRGGYKAARNSAIGCACLLAVIEGVGIGFQRMMAENTKLEVCLYPFNHIFIQRPLILSSLRYHNPHQQRREIPAFQQLPKHPQLNPRNKTNLHMPSVIYGSHSTLSSSAREAGTVVFSILGYVLPLSYCLHSPVYCTFRNCSAQGLS